MVEYIQETDCSDFYCYISAGHWYMLKTFTKRNEFYAYGTATVRTHLVKSETIIYSIEDSFL